MVNYQEAYGLFVCNGIFSNHEPPHHGDNFVIQKITKAIRQIKISLQEKLCIKNLKVF
jgi:GDP-D-mannose dehydratase